MLCGAQWHAEDTAILLKSLDMQTEPPSQIYDLFTQVLHDIAPLSVSSHTPRTDFQSPAII